MRCATTVGAMKMARDMMLADPEINTVLIAGGYRVSDFIDFRNARTSFMWNIATGAGAMLLRKGWPTNHVLGSHIIVDGSMSKHVVIPASGTAQFATPQAMAGNTLPPEQFTFDLVEPEAMKNRLNAVSMDNWLRCVDEALRKSGRKPDGSPFTRRDIDYLNMILIKPSGHQEMLERLGLSEEQSVYLGAPHRRARRHVQHPRRRCGWLKDGDLMAIVAAGIGYVWAAGVVQWGTPQERQIARISRKGEFVQFAKFAADLLTPERTPTCVSRNKTHPHHRRSRRALARRPL